MEHLVLELKNLNFQQIRNSEHSNKHEPPLRDKGNCLNQRPLAAQHYLFKAMTDKAKHLNTEEDCEEREPCSPSSSVSSEENSFDASEEESEIDVFHDQNSKNCNKRGGVNIRKLPRRSVKTDILRAKSLRTSMKTPKTSPKTTEKLRPAQIKKLYTNKKLTNFRPTSLETIFEEPQPMRGGGDTEQFRLVGAKKLRRTLVCSDGINTNKAVVNRRLARIKSKLGRRISWKKIPLKNFLSYMQSTNLSENEDEGLQPSGLNAHMRMHDPENTTITNRNKLETEETFSTGFKTINESEDFEMDLPDVKA